MKSKLCDEVYEITVKVRFLSTLCHIFDQVRDCVEDILFEFFLNFNINQNKKKNSLYILDFEKS